MKSKSKKYVLDIFSKEKIKNKKIKKPKIIVDTREKQSLIASELLEIGCEVEFKHLYVGDYVIGKTIIERKTISDFLSSMTSGRLRKQLTNMQSRKSKLLLIEGIEEQELYHEESTMNENAVRGFLLSITLNYKIPIIFTKDYKDTAKFLKVLAKKPSKEQEMSYNIKPKPLNTNEQLQFLLEGFPGIGPKNAKKLLGEFKTFRNIIDSPIKKLQELIGKKADIFKLLDFKYS